MPSATINGLTWNIKSGGFASYDPGLEYPERGEIIQRSIASAIRGGVDTISLVDANRWDEIYKDHELGSNAGIAKHLGLQAARFLRLDDKRLIADKGAGIGVLLATDHPIAETHELDLGKRNALGVILDIGSDGVQIITAYNDDLSPEDRFEQVRAVVEKAKKGIPTIITGDLNTVRASTETAAWHTKARSRSALFLARTLPHLSNRFKELTTLAMMDDDTLSVLEMNGFEDAGKPACLPTWPARAPIVGVDYVFHNRKVAIQNYSVLRVPAASDHCQLLYTATVQ